MSDESLESLPIEFKDLGTYHSVHHIEARQYAKTTRNGLLLLFIFVAMACMVVFGRGEPLQDLSSATMPAIVIVCLLGLLARHYHNRGRRILVFDDGFVDIRRRKPTICRWGDINSVKEVVTVIYLNGVRHMSVHGLLVKPNERPTIPIFGHPKDVRDFSDRLHREVLARQHPRAVELLNQEKYVDFEYLKVASIGLFGPYGGLDWESINSVKIANGILIIRKQGMSKDWFHRNIGDIPNSRLLFVLLENYTTIEWVPTKGSR